MYATLSNFFINGLYDLKTTPVDYFFPTIVDEKALIAKFNCRFSKSVDSHHFTGVFSIEKMVCRRGSYYLTTKFDINNGAQVADVTMVITP